MKNYARKHPSSSCVRSVRTWAIAAACGGLILVAGAGAEDQLVTGKRITPTGTQQNVGSLPMNLVLSPDGKYAVSTDMGFRQSLWSLRTSDGQGVSHLDYPNTTAAPTNGLYYGLAFAADGTLYAAQGENQTVAVLKLGGNGSLTPTRTITAKPHDFPSGLALDGKGHLYVANNDPDTFAQASSVAVYDALLGHELGRYTFNSSFGGTPNFPLSIAALADGSKLYVASQRDSAVFVLDTSDPANPKLAGKVSTGAHPDALLLNKKQDKLFVANGQSDTVSVVSTSDDIIIGTLLLRPSRLSKIAGVTPTGLALSADAKTLFVTLGDMNAVAVVDVDAEDLNLRGYIPVGWYPTGVVVGGNGSKLLVSNAKGVVTRYPNPGYVQFTFNSNPQYDQNLIEGTVSTLSIPDDDGLRKETQQVLQNNGASEGDDEQGDHNRGDSGKDNSQSGRPPSLDGLGLKAGKIKHVIYIVKENRTYDQVLGDLPQGNGDPSLVLFGRKVTPNLHAIAERFVLLDNFYDCGEVSGDGWPWSTQGIANEYVIKDLPYNYSGRGRNYDFEGQNNGYPVGGFPSTGPDGNQLSDVFPAGKPAIPDVAEAAGGHLWDTARKAGLSYRNYGFFYTFGVTQKTPTGGTVVVIPDNYPASAGIQPPGHDLAGISDIDYRRYDNAYADSDGPANYGVPETLKTYGKYNMPSRFSEWNREFQEMLKKDPSGGAVPALMTVRFNHDHTQGLAPGAFSPRAEVADNDYACGQLVEAISKSPIWESTAIFVIEDDSQDGPDHVDAHRSTCYVISPWIKAHSVDHTFYNTDSVLKTIELLVGLPPLSSYDAIATPIRDWDAGPANNQPFNASPAEKSIMTEINQPTVMLKPGDKRIELVKMSEKMDFDHPDSAPARLLNEMIWKSVKGPDSQMPKPRRSIQLSKAPTKSATKKDLDE